MVSQCHGVTRAGKRCTITSSSLLRDRCSGRLAAEPLRRGANFCLFHCELFPCVAEEPACPSFAKDQDAIVVHIDLETTSLDRISTDIVEIAAVEDRSNAVFASLARPPDDADDTARRGQSSSAAIAEAVHGISDEELRSAPPFHIVFERFLWFLEDLRYRARRGHGCERTFADACTPGIILVAHNGLRFDFPVLACQCRRAGLGVSWLSDYRFCDSLDLLQAVRPQCKELLLGTKLECLKLQCLGHSPDGTRAHRALDDARKLQGIVTRCAAWLSMPTQRLVQQTSRQLDIAAFEATLASLLDDKHSAQAGRATRTIGCSGTCKPHITFSEGRSEEVCDSKATETLAGRRSRTNQSSSAQDDTALSRKRSIDTASEANTRECHHEQPLASLKV